MERHEKPILQTRDIQLRERKLDKKEKSSKHVSLSTVNPYPANVENMVS